MLRAYRPHHSRARISVPDHSFAVSAKRINSSSTMLCAFPLLLVGQVLVFSYIRDVAIPIRAALSLFLPLLISASASGRLGIRVSHTESGPAGSGA